MNSPVSTPKRADDLGGGNSPSFIQSPSGSCRGLESVGFASDALHNIKRNLTDEPRLVLVRVGQSPVALPFQFFGPFHSSTDSHSEQ